MSVTRTVLQRFPIPELPGYESRLVKLYFPPGCAGQIHTHPVEGSSYVVEGAILEQWEDGKEEIHQAGETFLDRRDVLHVRTENMSKTEPLVIIVHYVIQQDVDNVHMV